MKVKKSSAKTNIIMVSTTLLVAFSLFTEGKAEETRFKSQGKIIFDNRTEDPSDDVIFDASDFNRLAFVCR